MEFRSLDVNISPLAVDVSTPPEQLNERRQLIQAVKALNATELFGQDNELIFGLDREGRRPVLRIVNRETRELVRQIPPEYALRMAEQIRSSQT